MKVDKSILCLILLLTSLAAVAETPEEADKRRRNYIDDFISTYKAAYEQKEIEYIDDFFSNDALVITETKKLVRKGANLLPGVNKKRPYQLNVENKKKYIARLDTIFKSNKSITLGLSGKRVVKHPLYPEIYGVSFLQIWLDQNGGNNLENQMPGYIFLLIDFKKNEIQPTVHIRTWQPKDNIREVTDKFNIMDFRINEY